MDLNCKWNILYIDYVHILIINHKILILIIMIILINNNNNYSNSNEIKIKINRNKRYKNIVKI